uniref:Innexin n=1 Tax=Angiostrongylus cantonensis TaxID=6313 RepID=A0A0K0CYT2_ANGCA
MELVSQTSRCSKQITTIDDDYAVEKEIEIFLEDAPLVKMGYPNIQVRKYATERQLSYYQWVPFFLLLQAAFFRAPSFVWRSFSNHSGIRMHEVVGKAKDSANVDEEVRQKNITILARHLENALHFHRRIPKRQVGPPL